MRTLSIQQPWATLIARGLKPVENRSWHSPNRGPFLIHAGQRYDIQGEMWIRNNWWSFQLPTTEMTAIGNFLDELTRNPAIAPRGGIVGSAHMIACVQHNQSPWFFGPYGFVLTDAHELPFRPCRGKLGWFDVDYDSLAPAADIFS